jgi:hypothetical protein
VNPSQTFQTTSSSACLTMLESLKLEAVQQRAEQFAGLKRTVPILRAYLAGAFDQATHVTFAAPDSSRVALTDSKRNLVTVGGKKVKVTTKALIPAVGLFASLEGLTIREVFGRKHPLLDRFIDHGKGAQEHCIVSRDVGDAQSTAISTVYNGISQEAAQQRAEVYNRLVLPPCVLRAYLAGAFDDVDSVTHAKTGKTYQFIASKRWVVGGKTMSGQMLVPAVGEFAAFGRCTIAIAFGVEHPLLDQFIKQKGVNSKGWPIYAIVSTASFHLESVRSSFYSGLTLDAVQQRAEVYNGIALSPAVLRAYLAGAFDDVDCLTHAKTGKAYQFTASKRGLVGKLNVSGQMLVPAVGEFAAFGRCTIATAFGVEHPLLDRFIKQTGITDTRSRYTIVSTTPSAVARAFFASLTLDAVQQRAEVYNGIALSPAVLRAYLAGAFDDVDYLTHAKTGKTHQFTASKRSLAGGKTMSGQMLVPAVGKFAAFGRCTIVTAFGVEHPLLDRFIKQKGLDCKGGILYAISTSVKPRRTATSAKRRRGKSPATAPTHGLMTPLLLPPATQPAKHAKLVVPPGHHPHPCVSYE